MVLKRPEVCALIQFRSWTGVMFWIMEVAKSPWNTLTQEFLEKYRNAGAVPTGDDTIKDYFICHADELERKVMMRLMELENREEGPKPDMSGWGLREHYEHFMVNALAADRYAAHRPPLATRHYLSTKPWALEKPAKIFEIMYEFTDALCHNYWKTWETDQWDSDDSDVPFTNPDDVPIPRN